MLQDIRDNSQGVVAKVMIGLIVAIFALFGVDSIINGFISTPPVAEINGEEISQAQLDFNTQNLLSSIGGNLDSFDQDLLNQIAMNQIIEETVLRQSAENASMTISSNRIDRAIIQTQSFQIDGSFDSDFAVLTMNSQGYTVPAYRAAISSQMILSQVASAYANSNFITRTELETLAELSAQTRDFRYLTITMGTRTLGTAIADSEIQAYYDEHEDDFIEAETVVVDYVLLDQDVISEEIELDEAELLAQYEIEKGTFEGASEKRASHILIEVNGEVNEAAAIEQAQAALERIQNGEEFGAVALEVSIDTASAEQAGDIGYSDGGAFPVPIEEALEVLALNEVSDPIVSEFGVHLVKLTEDASNVFQTFDEVSGRIERDLKRSQVELLYAERLEDLSNLAFESSELADLATELNLVVLESPAFGRTGGRGEFADQNLVAAAYSDEVLLEGNNSDVIELSPTRSAVLRVATFNESSVRPLDDVQAEIAVLLRTDMERHAVEVLGDEVLTAVESGTGVEELLIENELEWIDALATERRSFNVNAAILGEAFSLSSPDQGPVRSNLILDNGTFAIIELNQINAGSFEELEEEEQNSMSNALLSDLGNSDFEAFITHLKATADIQQSAASEI